MVSRTLVMLRNEASLLAQNRFSINNQLCDFAS